MTSPVVLSEPFLQPPAPLQARLECPGSDLCKASWVPQSVIDASLRPAGCAERRRGPYASGDCPAIPPTTAPACPRAGPLPGGPAALVGRACQNSSGRPLLT